MMEKSRTKMVGVRMFENEREAAEFKQFLECKNIPTKLDFSTGSSIFGSSGINAGKGMILVPEIFEDEAIKLLREFTETGDVPPGYQAKQL